MVDSKPAALDGAAATGFLAASERVKPYTRLIGLLALGRFLIDVTQGSLPAVLPFLKQAHALTYAQAAMISVSVVLGRAYLVADGWGVPTALWISALMPLVAFVLTRFLPAPRDAAA